MSRSPFGFLTGRESGEEWFAQCDNVYDMCPRAGVESAVANIRPCSNNKVTPISFGGSYRISINCY